MRLYKFGGVGFIVSGLLFLSVGVLDLVTGPPPATGAAILAWITAQTVPLSLINELLFFAAMFLVPAVIALYDSLATVDRVKAATGCGIMATVIPVTAILAIVHGRLVYPVYGLRVDSPDIAELVVAVFQGGMHAIAIMFGIATLLVSLAMRGGIYGRPIVFLGMVAGVLDIIASYPWVIGPVPTFVCQLFFAAWFVAVGSKLYGRPLDE